MAAPTFFVRLSQCEAAACGAALLEASKKEPGLVPVGVSNGHNVVSFVTSSDEPLRLAKKPKRLGNYKLNRSTQFMRDTQTYTNSLLRTWAEDHPPFSALDGRGGKLKLSGALWRAVKATYAVGDSTYPQEAFTAVMTKALNETKLRREGGAAHVTAGYDGPFLKSRQGVVGV
jgi:hypothetical protein